MQKTYSISVIIPSYNRKSTIKRCIDSILIQTYQIFEIIIVDDGSDDGTLEFIEKEYKSDKRIQIIKQNHKGAQAARNTGIRVAQGEYIAFLDSDDEWLPDKLAVQVQELKKNPNVVICGDGIIQQDWLGSIPKVYDVKERKNNRIGVKKPFKLHGKSGYVYKEILNNSFCLFQALLTSKRYLLNIGMLDENVPAYQEWDTAIRLAEKYEFVYLHKPLFVYHLHDGETISKSIQKDIDGLEYIYGKYQIEIIRQLGCNGLTKKYKDLLKKCVKYNDKRTIKYLFKYIMSKVNLVYINKL